MTPIGKSVSVSFRVRVVRACVRAKLCGRVWPAALNAGASAGQISGSGLDFGSAGFVAIIVGFNVFFQICSL